MQRTSNLQCRRQLVRSTYDLVTSSVGVTSGAAVAGACSAVSACFTSDLKYDSTFASSASNFALMAAISALIFLKKPNIVEIPSKSLNNTTNFSNQPNILSRT